MDPIVKLKRAERKHCADYLRFLALAARQGPGDHGDMNALSVSVMERAMLEGFLDCEELIASMLERLAADERRRAFLDSNTKHMDRAAALTEAALAVRMGQHRKDG